MLRLARAAVLALVLVCAPAFSATLADRHVQLADEVATRLAALTGRLNATQKREKSALTRASLALAAETFDLAKELSNDRKIVAALEPVFGEDATIGPLLDQVAIAADLDVTARQDRLAFRTAALPESVALTKALKLVAAAQARIDVARTGTTRKKRVSRLRKAFLVGVLVGERFVAKARIGLPVLDTEWEATVDGSLVFVPAQASLLTVSLLTNGSTRLFVNADTSVQGVIYHISFAIADPSVGAHSVLLTPESHVMGTSGFLNATAGTVDLTTWDLDGMKVGGTFEVTYSNGTQTVVLTGGSFSSLEIHTN